MPKNKEQFKNTAKAVIGLALVLAAAGAVFYLPRGGNDLMASIIESLKPKREFPKNTEVGIWFWSAPGTYSPAELEEIATWLAKEGITDAYVRIDDYIDIVEQSDVAGRELRLAAFTVHLKELSRIFHAKGIKVHGLGGHPRWSSLSHRYIPERILTFVIEYNRTALTNERLDGMQFDIEPYQGNSRPPPEEEVRMMKDYLTTIERLNSTAVRGGTPVLPVGFVIPYWYDNRTRILPLIEWKGQTKPFAFHIIDEAARTPNSHLIVMAYRNKPDGHNGTIAVVEDELSYAGNLPNPPKVLIGQETNNTQPPSITFYGKKRWELKKAVQTVYDHYLSHPAFGGFAIHQYESFRKMKN